MSDKIEDLAGSRTADPANAASETGNTADNVIRIQPQDTAGKPKNMKSVLRIVLIAAAALVAVAALVMIMFPDLLDFDRIKRYFHYLGKRDKDNYGSISFDASGSNVYGSVGDGFVLGTDGGMYYFDLYGEQKLMVQGSVSEPHLLTNSDRALCYAITGSYFAEIDKEGNRIVDRTISGSLLDADMSSDGFVCYNTTQSGYKTVATVLNRSGEAMYLYRSSTQYLNACAVSPGGGYLAVAGLNEEDSAFSSSVTVLKTDEEIVAGSDKSKTSMRRLTVGNQILYDMAFLTADRLCAIGQSSVLFVNTDGEVVSEYTAESGYLRGYAFGGKDFVVLLYSEGVTGDRYEIVTLNQNGDVLGKAEWNRPVRSISASGRYFAVLTDSECVIYTSRLKQYAKADEAETAAQVVMREDGTALLVSSDHAKLFIP